MGGNCSKAGPMWGNRQTVLQPSGMRGTRQIHSWIKRQAQQEGMHTPAVRRGSWQPTTSIQGVTVRVCLWGQGGMGCCGGHQSCPAALLGGKWLSGSQGGKPHLRYPWRDVKLLQSDSFMMTRELRSGSVSGRSLLQGKLVRSCPGKTGPWWLHIWWTQLFCWSELLQGEIQNKSLPDILTWHKKKGQKLSVLIFQDFPQRVSYTSDGTFAQETAYSEIFPESLLIINH